MPEERGDQGLEALPWDVPGEAVARTRAGMVVDLRRCIGCHACSVACKTEHDVALGRDEPVGSFRQRVRFLEGVHPRALCCAHHVGHWQHGPVAKGDLEGVLSPGAEADPAASADRDIPDNIWWAKDAGGPGHGVAINDALPINPSPLVGGQNWYDNVATIEKL